MSIDPLRDEPEYVVRTFSEGFQRASMESREVGAGDADDSAVESAWRLHQQLGTTESIKSRQRTFLYLCYITAGFATTFLSVVFSFAKTEDVSTDSNSTCFNRTDTDGKTDNKSDSNNSDTNGVTDNDTGLDYNDIQWPATAVACIASICIGILNLLATDETLQRIQNAQANIVYEIFRFRMVRYCCEF